MHEVLCERQTAFRRSEHGIFRHPDILDGETRVVRRHVEGPHVFFDDHAGIARRDDQAGDALGVAVLAAGTAEQHDVGRDMHAGDPHLLAIDQPAVLAVLPGTHGAGFHVRRVGAVVRLGQAKAGDELAGQGRLGEMFLVRAREVPQHQDLREVADDRMLVLKVVVQAEALLGKVFADDRHAKV